MAVTWRHVRLGVLAGLIASLLACSSPGTGPKAGRLAGFIPQHLVKSDLNRFAELHQQRNCVNQGRAGWSRRSRRSSTLIMDGALKPWDTGVTWMPW